MHATKLFLQISPLRSEIWGSFEGEAVFFRALGSKKIRFTLKTPPVFDYKNLFINQKSYF